MKETTSMMERQNRGPNYSRFESQSVLTTSMRLDYMLGTNYVHTPTSNCFVSGPRQVVSYGKNIFSKFNISNKQAEQVLEESWDATHARESKVLLSKYFGRRSNNVLMVLKRTNEVHYISLFWVDTSSTSIVKICTESSLECVNFTYHPKKSLLYVLLTDKSGPKSQQFIRVLEIEAKHSEHKLKNGGASRSKIILNCLLKKTGGVTEDLTDLTVSSDSRELYLFGSNYFRQWILSFNDKTAKESNYRNIERNLKNEKIVNLFWVKENDLGKSIQCLYENTHQCLCPNYLILVTSKFMLVIKKNQLLKKIEIPMENPFFRVEQEPAQIALEKSLNQIYRTKFRMFPQKDEQEEDFIKERNDRTKKTAPKIDSTQLCAVSEGWVGHDSQGNKQVKFIGAFTNDKIFVYRILPELELKVDSEVNSNNDTEPSMYSFMAGIRNISVSRGGHLSVFRDDLGHIYYLSQEESRENNEITPFYGSGHPHKSAVISLSTPELSLLMASVSEHGSLKVWSYGEDEKRIVMDNKPKVKPLSAIVHPCGFLVIVNFGLEIKIYGLVSSEFAELVAIKTSDICMDLLYSKSAHILVSNEKSMIKLYEPFTLKCTGRVEPHDMRLEVIKCAISDNGEYLVYQCCDFSVFRKSINSIYAANHEKPEVEEFLKEEGKDYDKKANLMCHRQSEKYTCFYFDFGLLKTNATNNSEGHHSPLLCRENIFAGFTRNKYMVLYGNYGQDLVAQFPIEDCHVVQAEVKENLMFLATSRGAIRAYEWPIRQSHCQVEKLAGEDYKAFLKAPKWLQQFQVWMDYTPITCLHALPNSSQLAIGSEDGYIGFVSYRLFRNGNEQVEKEDTQTRNERKKMVKAMNNVKLMKVSEIDRINKLIEKTQTDIEKIDFQIRNQKIRKNTAMHQEHQDYSKNLAKRRDAYFQECNDSYRKILDQICTIEDRLSLKRLEVVQKIDDAKAAYKSRREFQEERIASVRAQQQELKNQQRNKILNLIQAHKENIRTAKQENLKKICDIKNNFEKFSQENFSESYQIIGMEGLPASEEVPNEEIWAKTLKVEQLKNDIMEKQKNLQQIREKFRVLQGEDQKLQGDFEEHLEVYNTRRQTNLILHSELLKMQNQLLERQQILSKKDELIAMAFQQKEASLIFRGFVKGNLTRMECQKQAAIDTFLKKEEELNFIFQELKGEIRKGEAKKLEVGRIDEKINLFERQREVSESKIKMLMDRIQKFKKFLLLQGVSQDTQQKKIYQDQQRLLTQIKWLEKRFAMACVNETKLVALKKSGMRQVIQQNKNLLEECNQLREEGIDYDNQINHLRQKLGEANQIIEFERKIRNQNHVITSQTQKLDLIRKMLREQIDSASRQIDEEEEVEYPF